MRRQFSLIVILLWALNVSGWGGVLAAALCPHAAQMAAAKGPAASPLKTKEHASCHAKADQSASQSSMASSHEANADGKAPSSTREAGPLALTEPARSCQHCVSHRGLPTEPVKTRDSQPGRTDAGNLYSPDAKTIAPPVFEFAQAVVPTQGAPPGRQARRHLLLSVFLI
ncbi:MAG TPA: hypothetical protein VGX92_12965 [Pyrinomonadaceae bacterium]|jgi:hypothetical protein|nr:hypothetical protein [Pyrinomonadaceae bacterium]